MLYYEPMQIKTYLHDFFLIFLLFNLISCSSLDSVPEFLPKIHKIDIQQGNEISSEMLMMLKPGMTKSQVRFVLGTPLIQDTFHKERWDYVYTMSVDDIVIETRYVVLNFADEQLKNITGEVIPKKNKAVLEDELKKDNFEVNKEGVDKSLTEVQDKKKNNDEAIGVPSEEKKSSQLKNTLSDAESKKPLSDSELLESIDTSESINEAIKQDIIDSLPAKDDAGYFDLLLEKIGF